MVNQALKKARIDLHFHPVGLLTEEYSIEDLVEAAEKKQINVIGLVEHNGDIFSLIKGKSWCMPKDKYISRAENGSCIAISNKESGNTTYILRATEMTTGDENGDENLHMLFIGDISKLELRKEKPFPRTEKCIETMIKNEGIILLDHPYVNSRFIGRSINKSKEEYIENLLRESRGKIALEWNPQCKPILRMFTEGISSLAHKDLTGYNVNRNAERLAERLNEFDVRVIADSDVHARKKSHLKGIGTGCIELFREAMDYSGGKAIIKSVKNAVKVGEGGLFGYTNVKEYVSIAHFESSIGIPYLFNLEKNRG